MHTLTATYRIVTPMFLGDAEQKATEIRPPSVKGALRFWWRALNWGRFRENASNDAAALQRLHEAEAELFGAAAEENKPSGQSSFLLSAKYVQDTTHQEISWDRFSGIQYLLGQGLWHFREKLLRPYLAPGSLILELRLKSKISAEQIQQLKNALLALGLFGGLGSRARRGLGSLAIQNIKDESSSDLWVPKNSSDLKQAEKRLSLELSCDLPPISAFSARSRLDISLQSDGALQLLNTIGEEFQVYRSWGKSDRQGIHKVGNRRAEQNFPEDHDGMRQAANGLEPSALPKRSVFGYPHNYFFSSDKAKVDIAPAGKSRGRRASPLFIHIHRFPDETHAALQALLPATFLPACDRVELKSKKPLITFGIPAVDWKVIHDYMNRFEHREAIIHAAS